MLRDLNTPVRYLKGVGLKRAEVFERIGVTTIDDLLYYFPKRYEDRSSFSPLDKLTPGDTYTIKAKVLVCGQRHSMKRKGFNITDIVLGDDTGKIHCVWFNRPYLKSYLKVGTEVVVYGKVERYQDRLQIQSPEFEVLKSNGDKENSLNSGKIVPVYSLTQGVSQRYFRKIIRSLLNEFIPKVCDVLPYDIRKRHSLLNLAQSLIHIHFPEDECLHKEAYRRLSFEEFFLYQIPVLMRKMKREHKKGIIHNIDGEIFNSFINSLPFKLTAAQERVVREIKKDMSSHSPMQRLLQGEVASGKTVVAWLSAAIAFDGSYQVAFMVPTEILAKQHFNNCRLQNRTIRLALLSSSLPEKQKDRVYREIKDGKVDLVIGTHSLLEENLKFRNLGLVIIDEQHKFGVGQRALLPRKGNNPDCLIMTATPIPRTLSLTIYGDLDISILDQLPQGRLPVETKLYRSDQRPEVYRFIGEKISEGRQVYVVCPNIEESESLGLRSAVEAYLEIKDEICQAKVGLVHGRLKQEEQDKIMSDFKNGLIDILVATTVLEVGIDVANASVMLIEDAQAFGLSQLHQLRGRIGRGGHQSHCLLIANLQSKEAVNRIKAISTLSDGFKIAEEDLKIRGPGEFFGSRQHGLVELKIANPLTQMHLLKNARDEVNRLLRSDPDLNQRQNLGLKQILKRRFPEYEELMMVG